MSAEGFTEVAGAAVNPNVPPTHRTTRGIGRTTDWSVAADGPARVLTLYGTTTCRRDAQGRPGRNGRGGVKSAEPRQGKSNGSENVRRRLSIVQECKRPRRPCAGQRGRRVGAGVASMRWPPEQPCSEAYLAQSVPPNGTGGVWTTAIPNRNDLDYSNVTARGMARTSR